MDQIRYPEKILLVGHSHINCLVAAARGLEGLNFTAIHLSVVAERAKHEQREFNDVLAEIIRSEKSNRIIASIGGNAHQIIGLIERTPPFDFYAEEGDVLPGRWIVPRDVLRDMFEWGIASYFVTLRLVNELAGGTAIQIESPPPINSLEFLRTNLDKYFVDRGDTKDAVIAPASLRHKLWRLDCSLFRDECERIGMHYLPIGADLLDEQGFMHPSGYGDATHGNVWYGNRMLKEAIGVWSR